VVQELWAKLSAGEKFIVYGAGAVVVGWIVGTFLGSANPCSGLGVGAGYCPSFNYFSWGNAGLASILALVAAVLAVGIIYVKFTPTIKITWPMPVEQIFLGVCVAAVVLAALTALFNITGGPSAITGGAISTPITVYLADVLIVGGGAVMAWFSYQAYVASKVA
jgi:hypothetical protein